MYTHIYKYIYIHTYIHFYIHFYICIYIYIYLLYVRMLVSPPRSGGNLTEKMEQYTLTSQHKRRTHRYTCARHLLAKL